MCHATKTFVIFAFMLTLWGCTSTDNEIKNTGFLSDYSKLAPVDLKDDSITTKYQSSETSLTQYAKVFITPINYYPEAPTNKQIPQAVQDEIKAYIATHMQKTFDQKYQIVEQAGPDTFTLKVGITGLIIDDKPLAVYQYIPISFLLTAATGSLNDMTVKLRIEAEAYDSQSKEVIAAFTKLDSGETLASKDTKLTFAHLEPLLSNWFTTLDKSINK